MITVDEIPIISYLYMIKKTLYLVSENMDYKIMNISIKRIS